MVNALTKLFESHSTISVALLFGSCATGTQTFDSDIDVAVLAENPISSDYKIMLVEELAAATGRAIDLIDLRAAGQPLLGQILKNAIRLKGSDSDMASLYIRNVIEVADFMPYVIRTLKERQQAWTKS
jgi:uncharacterized protein